MDDLALARLSARAYDVCTHRCDGDGECLIEVADDGALGVAFRGTEADFNDILRDVRGYPWYDWQLGFCHRGFLDGTRDMWPAIAREVMQPGVDVFLTGHSLGGAMAAITAAHMTMNGKRPAALVTFGAPRPAFAKLSSILQAIPTRRYVHGIDCVPSHPWPIWGYRHPGDAINVRHPDTFVDRFTDHRIKDYVAALECAAH